MEASRVAQFSRPGLAAMHYLGAGFFTQSQHCRSSIFSGTRLARDVNGGEGGMEQDGLEEFIAEFRVMLPAQSETAQAIDRREPFERIAFKAIDDGYIEFADQFSRFIEVCLRRSV